MWTLSKCQRVLPECCLTFLSDIDVSFFLVTVDLWSADGKQEMNLVLHPTSADRYVPANTPKTKRRGTKDTTSSSAQRSARQSSPTPSVTPSTSNSQYPQVSVRSLSSRPVC